MLPYGMAAEAGLRTWRFILGSSKLLPTHMEVCWHRAHLCTPDYHYHGAGYRKTSLIDRLTVCVEDEHVYIETFQTKKLAMYLFNQPLTTLFDPLGFRKFEDSDFLKVEEISVKAPDFHIIKDQTDCTVIQYMSTNDPLKQDITIMRIVYIYCYFLESPFYPVGGDNFAVQHVIFIPLHRQVQGIPLCSNILWVWCTIELSADR